MVTAKAKIVEIDFSNVKDQGKFNRSRIPAGDYLAKVIAVENTKAKDEVSMLEFGIQIVKRPSSKLPYYCKLQENQLWKLRNLLIAAGKAVPKSKMKVNPNEIVGKLIGVTVEDDEFEGDKGTVEQSSISGVFPAAELGDVSDLDEDGEDEEEEAEEADDMDDLDDTESVEEEPEEEEAEEEPEEEEEAGDEWDAITDRLELRKALKRLSPDTKTATSMSDDDIRDLIREAAAKAAKPKSAAKAAPAKAKAKPAAKTVSDEELEELDIDDL